MDGPILSPSSLCASSASHEIVLGTSPVKRGRKSTVPLSSPVVTGEVAGKAANAAKTDGGGEDLGYAPSEIALLARPLICTS